MTWFNSVAPKSYPEILSRTFQLNKKVRDPGLYIFDGELVMSAHTRQVVGVLSECLDGLSVAGLTTRSKFVYL